MTFLQRKSFLGNDTVRIKFKHTEQDEMVLLTWAPPLCATFRTHVRSTHSMCLSAQTLSHTRARIAHLPSMHTSERNIICHRSPLTSGRLFAGVHTHAGGRRQARGMSRFLRSPTACALDLVAAKECDAYDIYARVFFSGLLNVSLGSRNDE